MTGPAPGRCVAVVTGDPGRTDPTKRGGRYHEEDRLTHEAMRAAFESLPDYGFAFLDDDDTLFDRLRALGPALAVNFCDTGYQNVPTRELHVPAWLELHDIAYTGAPPAAIATCYDKQIVRLVAQALDVPVPREVFLSAETGPEALPDSFPAILKPNNADGSVGITRDALVRSRAQAERYLAWLHESLPGRDVLVQEYLPGPEYGIGLIGNPGGALRALPALEVDFSALPSGLAPILSYESKALPDSPYWTEIRFQRATLDAAAEERMAANAKRLFVRLGLRDYARFDYRTAADGTVRLMEVNPNPAWANDGKLAFMAGFAGISYAEMLAMILDAAFARLAGQTK